MKHKLLFLIFLIGFNTFSQEIYIDTKSNYIFNKNNEELLVFKNDSVSIYDINSFHLLKKKEIISPPNFNFLEYHILDKEPIHFIENNGGKVYQLNNDTIQRIDNSYTHKMAMFSNLFIYNDTIYRYGGYGYWTTNNKLTFYDTVTSEWQIINSANGIYPKGSASSFHKILNDKLYIIGGLKVNPKEQNESIFSDEIWSFDFKTKKWENLGVLNSYLANTTASFKVNDNIFYVAKNNIEEIDLKNNLRKKYALSPLMQKACPINKPFVHKENIYLWLRSDIIDSPKLLKKRIDTFNFMLVDEEALVNNYWVYALNLVIFIACIISLIFLYYFRKKHKNNSNKLLFKNNKVSNKDNVTNLNPDENKLLTMLINNDFRITNEHLINSFYNPVLDRSQNIRNVNKFISDLNLKLKSMINTNNEILYKTVNPLDRRMKIVILNRDFFKD